jgi:hypothetical protein
MSYAPLQMARRLQPQAHITEAHLVPGELKSPCSRQLTTLETLSSPALMLPCGRRQLLRRLDGDVLGWLPCSLRPASIR